MANRNMFGPVRSNHPDMALVHFVLTFAADAEANGCAVTKSNGYVSSCARSAEGIWTITLQHSWASCWGLVVEGLAGNLRAQLTAQSVADSTPTVTVTFETGSTGSDIDPDSEVLYCTLFLKNSSYANQA